MKNGIPTTRNVFVGGDDIDSTEFGRRLIERNPVVGVMWDAVGRTFGIECIEPRGPICKKCMFLKECPFAPVERK